MNSNKENTLELVEKKAHENHVPIMMEDGLRFLLSYIDEHKEINRILELGTAVGYSAMNMAGLRESITITTIEVNPKTADEARKNIMDNHLSDRITVITGDAAEYETDEIFDLIFIDAAKAQYRNYLEHYYPNSRKGTVFVFDNLNFHGIVDDESLSHNRSTIQMVRKIKKFRNWLLVEPRFVTEFHKETGDGVAIARRVR